MPLQKMSHFTFWMDTSDLGRWDTGDSWVDDGGM